MNSMPQQQQPPQKKELLVFESNGKIRYYDGCKIVINLSKQFLSVTPNDENSSEITKTFNHDFYQQKNILCIFSPNDDSQGIALAFQNEETCQKINNAIQKKKNSIINIEDDNSEGEKFKQQFFLPIIKEIEENNEAEVPLTNIILDFLKSLTYENQEIYMNILKDANSKIIYSSRFKGLIAADTEKTETMAADSNNIQRNNTEIHLDNNNTEDDVLLSTALVKATNDLPFLNPTADGSTLMDDSKMEDERVNLDAQKEIKEGVANERRRSLRKRPLINYSNFYMAYTNPVKVKRHVKIEANEESHDFKKPATEDIYSKNKIVKPPNYKIKEYIENGIDQKKLIIFTSFDKKLCYWLRYCKQRKLFQCSRCYAKGVWARADVFYKDDGTEYVRFGSNQHICEPIEYSPDMFTDIKIIKMPNFVITPREYRGQWTKKITVYENEEQNLYREYIQSPYANKFYCSPCLNTHKISIMIKLFENHYNENETYIQLCRREHLCQAKKVITIGGNETKTENIDPGELETPNMAQPETPMEIMDQNEVEAPAPIKSETSIEELKPRRLVNRSFKGKIVEADCFKIETIIERSAEKKRLLIFDENDKNLVYIYSYEPSKNRFVCKECNTKNRKNRTHVSARLKQAENGMEFLELGSNDHVCKPQAYQPPCLLENYQTVPINNIKSEPAEEQPEITIELDFPEPEQQNYELPPTEANDEEDLENFVAGKNIEYPNFKIETLEAKTKIGKRKKNLTIFTTADKKYGYVYYFCNTHHQFVCKGCVRFHKRVCLKLMKNKNGNNDCAQMLHNHVCDPMELNPEIIHISGKVINKNNQPITAAKMSSVKKENIHESKIVQSNGFKIEEWTDNLGENRKRLILFKENDRTLVYSYYYKLSFKIFICSPCKRMGKHVFARLHQNVLGEKYLQLGPQEHICKPQNNDLQLSSVRENPKIESNSPENTQSTKIVHSDGFKLESSIRRGVEGNRLILFNEIDNRTMNYSYFYKKERKVFVCGACALRGKHVFARLNENALGEKYLQLGPQDHICKQQNNNVQSIPPKKAPKIESNSPENQESKIVHSDGFKLENSIRRGVEGKKLILFDQNHNNLFYCYYLRTDKNIFICSRCQRNGKHVNARLHQNDLGENYLQLGAQEHICKPQTNCFQPSSSRKRSSKNEANSSQNQNDSNLFESQKRPKMETNEHPTPPPGSSSNIKTVSKEITILEKPNFKIEYLFNVPGKRPSKHIIIFDSNNKNLCYKYSYDRIGRKRYFCNECQKLQKLTRVQLCHDKNGNEYLEADDESEHVCKPVKYIINESNMKIEEEPIQPQIQKSSTSIKKEKIVKTEETIIQHQRTRRANFNKVKQEPIISKAAIKIVQKPDFKTEYFTTEQNLQRKQLIIFDSNNAKLCYVFSYIPKARKYACNECQKIGKLILAQLVGNNNGGSEYLEVDDVEHVCNPVEYVSMEASPKVVKAPNYKFEYYTENGIERKTLCVYANEEKILCYNYFYNHQRNNFVCFNCRDNGKSITAKLLQNDEGEAYIKLSELEHVCQPQPEAKELDSSEYYLEMNDKNNVSKITVFQTQNKNCGYKFISYRDNRYRCHGCFENGKKICEIKLFEDEIGNFYVKNGSFEHSCQPFNHEA